MSERLELAVVQQQLGKKKGHLISQETIDELNRLAEDPDYGEEFLDSYITHFNILEKGKWSTPKYLSALKFFTLLESGHNAVDAYVKVFPDRLASRLARGENKGNMGGEASRYNASELVNEIKRVATVPVQLIHRNLLHEMILINADLARNARSEMVRQKAASDLIKELKPAEESNINLKVGMDEETKNQNSQLVNHIAKLASSQRDMLAAGLSIEDIQRLNVNIVKDNAIDAEIYEDDDDDE